MKTAPWSASTPRRRGAGFTLIEVMVALAIVAMMLLVAAPNFVEYRRNSELADAVSSLTLAAGTAKANALKSGRNVFVRANDTTVGWTSGWFVFADANWNNTYNADADEVILRHEALTSAIAATPAASSPLASGYIMFNGAGFPKTTAGAAGNGSVTLTTPTRSTIVILDTAGRIRSCKAGTTGCSSI